MNLLKPPNQNAQSIATVIHDIASPVTLIRLNLDLIEDQMQTISYDPKLKAQTIVLKRFLKRAITGVEKVTNILNHTATNQYQGYRTEPFSVKTEIKNVISTFEIRSKSENIKIRFKALEDLKIVGSKQAFHKVLGNLISNSHDAYLPRTFQKDKSINIKAFKSGEHFVITLEDKAGGIPKTIQNYLFRQQFTTKANGNGLGLISIRKLIEEHFNGYINCYTIKNQGTVFAIAFPIKY